MAEGKKDMMPQHSGRFRMTISKNEYQLLQHPEGFFRIQKNNRTENAIGARKASKTLPLTFLSDCAFIDKQRHRLELRGKTWRDSQNPPNARAKRTFWRTTL
ncbi:hypothetical protein [Fulvitalea axinellae]|uniref:hypothetical protein n=1 Tax=Fulvitalea axinellae TaxID=1182444 RepID=UPI0030CA44AF